MPNPGAYSGTRLRVFQQMVPRFIKAVHDGRANEEYKVLCQAWLVLFDVRKGNEYEPPEEDIERVLANIGKIKPSGDWEAPSSQGLTTEEYEAALAEWEETASKKDKACKVSPIFPRRYIERARRELTSFVATQTFRRCLNYQYKTVSAKAKDDMMT